MFLLACPGLYVPLMMVVPLLLLILYHSMFLYARTCDNLVSGITFPVLVAVAEYVSNCTAHSASVLYGVTLPGVR